MLLALFAASGCSSQGNTEPISSTERIAQICADPGRFAGETIELVLTGIERTDPICTGAGCGPSAPCCNTCDAYYVVPCPGDGVIAFVQDTYGFSCTGSECGLDCDPELTPDDTLRVTATVAAGGPPTPCCTPIRFGVPDAVATLDVVSHEIVPPDAGR